MRQLFPLNDVNWVVGPIEEVDAQGQRNAVTTGTVVGFLAASASPDATEAALALKANLAYVGGQVGYTAGDWLFQLDAAVLTKALLDTHFAVTGKAYFHISRVGAVRAVEEIMYSPTRWAT